MIRGTFPASGPSSGTVARLRSGSARPWIRGVLGALGLVVLLAAPSAAEVWRVSEWLQIQESIDSAAYGDTVLVAPGQYDRLVMRSGIHLVAEGGPEETILRNGYFWVIKADGVDSTAVIDGFTLDGVKASEGVLYAENSFLTVQNCVLKNGWSGVRALFSDLQIRNCTIRDCQNGIYMYESGGQILGTDIQLCITAINLVSSGPRIVRNTITRNSYGMALSDHSDPRFGGSLASANRVWNNGTAVKNRAYQKRSAVRTMKPMTLSVPLNWWGTDCPDSSMFQGDVDFSPWVDESGTRSLEVCEPAPEG